VSAVRTVQTPDILKTLKEFASDTITPLAQCDFVLHGVTTYVKTCHADTFTKYDDALKARYADEELMIADRVVFRQLYKISLLKKRECVMNLEYEIDPGEEYIQPQLILKPTSAIPFARYKPQELFTLLVKEFNKIKAAQGMLIGMFSEPMIEDLKKLVKMIYTKQFTSPFPVLLFNGIEPELAHPSQLILHFQAREEDRQIIEVEEGELIVEYIKPVFGKNGINAFGKRVRVDDIENEPFLSSFIDPETIETVEDDERIRLFSKRRGFVQYTPNSIKIANQVTLKNVKRVQSQVASEEQNEVEVLITQNDIIEDSVGEGVHLTSESIHISGHIADKARLEAKKLVIDGATHNGAKLFAKEAVIHRHKGVLRCHKAQIKLLEGGEVHGSYVHVDTALGGTIYADHVTLTNVKHHLKIYATESITIETVSGEDNYFVIDYKQIPIIKSRLEYIEEDIDELRYHLDEAKRHREQDIPKISKQIAALKEEAERIRLSSFNAVITITNPLAGLNTIKFALPKNHEIVFRTREGMRYEPFRLKQHDDTVTLLPVGLSVSL